MPRRVHPPVRLLGSYRGSALLGRYPQVKSRYSCGTRASAEESQPMMALISKRSSGIFPYENDLFLADYAGQIFSSQHCQAADHSQDLKECARNSKIRQISSDQKRYPCRMEFKRKDKSMKPLQCRLHPTTEVLRASLGSRLSRPNCIYCVLIRLWIHLSTPNLIIPTQTIFCQIMRQNLQTSTPNHPNLPLVAPAKGTKV